MTYLSMIIVIAFVYKIGVIPKKEKKKRVRLAAPTSHTTSHTCSVLI